MELREKLESIITSHVTGLKHTPSGWHKANCPVCHHRGHSPDRRERFGVLFQPLGFGMNCFNCGLGVRWEEGFEIGKDLRQFLSAVGVASTDIDSLVFEAYINRHDIISPIKRKSIRSPQLHWLSSDLPPNTRSVEDWLVSGCEHPDLVTVAEYALSRGITDLSTVSWSDSSEHLMRKRLLVPFHWNGRTVGFTGRMTGPNVNKFNRYYHEIPRHFIYNMDGQRDYNLEYTIVTEGVFDAMLVNGVGLLHNRCSPEQAHIINNMHTRPIVAPDRDDSGDALIAAAIENKWAVSFPPWERGIKDVSDAVLRYGRLYTIYSLIQHQEKDADKICIFRQLDMEKNGNKRVHT